MRHCLSNESTHAALVLGSWCDFPGIIPHDEILDIFKNKSKQSKDKERVSGNIQDGDVEMA
jgi:hypothetical protein